MKFDQIFRRFLDHAKDLKTVSVASCSDDKIPNSASKMLVEIALPNLIFFLDYKHTQTYANVMQNPVLSISFMDDAHFSGYRLTGKAEVLEGGAEYEEIKKKWQKRLIGYEADRIVQRVRGEYSSRDAENTLPENFIIVKVTGSSAAMIRPDRVFRASEDN